MATSLSSDYAAFFGWVGAALGVYAGVAVAIRRGWVRADGRLQAFLMILAGMLAQRATIPETIFRGRSGSPAGPPAKTLLDALRVTRTPGLPSPPSASSASPSALA